MAEKRKLKKRKEVIFRRIDMSRPVSTDFSPCSFSEAKVYWITKVNFMFSFRHGAILSVGRSHVRLGFEHRLTILDPVIYLN